MRHEDVGQKVSRNSIHHIGLFRPDMDCTVGLPAVHWPVSLHSSPEACGQVTTCVFIHAVEAAKCWTREKMSNRLTAHYRKVTISAHLEQEQ